MSQLRELAKFIYELKLKDLPDDVVESVKDCILDSMGASIGAANYEEIPSIVENILEVSGSDMKCSAKVWGSEENASVIQATLLNGIMAHALELDDVHTDSKTHIGAVVLPAAWTLAEAMDATGEELVEAVVAAYEVMARIGKGFGVASHRKKGWHVTGTAGTFGAAAACSKLLKLDVDKTIDALAMAGTQSSGLWAFLEDGATCKKLHTGRAAVNGLVAAYMAKSGMTGPENILTANDGGLYKATSDSYNLEYVTNQLGIRYELKYMDNKPYPCCRSTHCAIDASLAIKEKHNFSIEDIDKILVETYDIGVAQCGSEIYPTKPSEAKFSTRFTVASALIDGEMTLKQFEPGMIVREKVEKLAMLVRVESSNDYTERYPDHWGCRLTIKLNDGRRFLEEIEDASGSIYKPLDRTQLNDKFTSLTEPILGQERTKTLLEDIKNLESLNHIPVV